MFLIVFPVLVTDPSGLYDGNKIIAIDYSISFVCIGENRDYKFLVKRVLLGSFGRSARTWMFGEASGLRIARVFQSPIKNDHSVQQCYLVPDRKIIVPRKIVPKSFPVSRTLPSALHNIHISSGRTPHQSRGGLTDRPTDWLRRIPFKSS